MLSASSIVSPKTTRDEVVGEVGAERAAGRGRRDEVEAAADAARRADVEARLGLVASEYELPLLPPHRSEAARRRARAGRRRSSRRVSLRAAAADPPTRLSFPAVSETAATDQRLEQYARLAVQVGLNLQPGQTLVRQRAGRARAARARDRAGGVRGRRVASSTSSTPTSTCAAPTSSTPPTTSSASRRRGSSSGCDELGAIGRRAARDHRQPGARALRRPRRRARRPGADARGRRGQRSRLTDGALQLVDRRVPERGLGRDRLRRARRRAALGGGRDGGSPRRARSGRGVARAHRPAPGARRGAERAPVRPPPLPRPRHRPDDRPASRSRLAGGARRVARHRARREHADRGGLHDPGRAPRRRHRALDAAAADPGQHRARPRGALRGRPRRRGARRVGRGR